MKFDVLLKEDTLKVLCVKVHILMTVKLMCSSFSLYVGKKKEVFINCNYQGDTLVGIFTESFSVTNIKCFHIR